MCAGVLILNSKNYYIDKQLTSSYEGEHITAVNLIISMLPAISADCIDLRKTCSKSRKTPFKPSRCLKCGGMAITTSIKGTTMYNYQDRKTQYERYLMSDEWHDKRRQRFLIDHGICQMCGAPATDCHHLTYHHIYHEDIEHDLVSLCRPCHESVHRMMCRVTDISTGRRGWKDDIPAYVAHI